MTSGKIFRDILLQSLIGLRDIGSITQKDLKSINNYVSEIIAQNESIDAKTSNTRRQPDKGVAQTKYKFKEFE